MRRGGGQRIPRPEGWRQGGAAPWGDLARPLSAAEVAAAIAARPTPPADPPIDTLRSSAVLVALGDGPNGAEVLLTRRSETLTNHRGEISFPGGRVDPGETFEMAAVREAHEEVALDPAVVRLVGRLDPLSTLVSRSFIVPVVGLVADHPPLRPSAYEVDRIMWVPLVELTRLDTFREEIWHMSGDTRPMFFFELDDETVWGATARVLHQLLRVAFGICGPAADTR